MARLLGHAALVALALAALAGCTKTRACRAGTLLVDVQLDARAAAADTLTVVVRVDGVDGAPHALPHAPGVARGSIEIDFPRYQPGAEVSVAVSASASSATVGAGAASLALPAGCGSLPLSIGAASDGGLDAGADASPTSDAGDAGDAGPLGDLACFNLTCSQVACDGGTTTVSGVVYTPSGTVPVYNAFVYVPNASPSPMPTGVTLGVCDPCATTLSGSPITSTLTDAHGRFTLANVPVGSDIPLVIQVGRWRRQLTIPTVTACADTPLPSPLARLPRNRSEGDIPRIAVVTGAGDVPECVLRKLGVDDAEFGAPGTAARVQLYQDNGAILPSPSPFLPPAAVLWDNAGQLAAYDLAIFACDQTPNDKTTPELNNFSRYLQSGGRVYLSHYGYVWLYRTTPFSSLVSWTPGAVANASTTMQVTVDTSFPKGAVLSQWMTNLGALTGGQFPLTDWRVDLASAGSQVQRWISGLNPVPPPPDVIAQISVEMPVGASQSCGRVVFSDFHVPTTTTNNGVPFPTECISGTPSQQELELMFQLLDWSVCVPPP